MRYLNPQIASLAKKKKTSLVRTQVSCGIFQETDFSVTRMDKRRLSEEALLRKK
ncbi:hypothetical protein [Croceitalea sp. MTPC5]|uniref:hypothetical protein n=1 Tax=Croceitalea sp. MTPC5 TaxID=3056565 RepID=UPI0030D5AD07